MTRPYKGKAYTISYNAFVTPVVNRLIFRLKYLMAIWMLIHKRGIQQDIHLHRTLEGAKARATALARGHTGAQEAIALWRAPIHDLVLRDDERVILVYHPLEE